MEIPTDVLDKEPDKLWKEFKEAVEDKCGKRLQTKKQKKTNWMSEETVTIAKKRKNPKPKKTKMSGKNLTKYFRDLLRESRSTITTTSVKTSKMEMDMEEQGKPFKNL